MNLLFICSRNQCRSPTAEEVYKNQPHIQARSAGTEPSAKTKISTKLILWADYIFVMEKKHKQRITEKYPDECRHKEIIILDIPDEYKYMDEELIDEIRAGVDAYLSKVSH